MGIKTLRINDRGKTGDGIFQADVVFPSENCYSVEVKDPFLEPGEIEAHQEERLRWYFEEHLASPYTGREKAKRAADSIAFYGESMFSHLFSKDQALVEWQNLVNGLDKIQVQVYSTDSEFQALHWEALKDPKESKPYCLKGVEFIRTSGVPTPELVVHPGTCLNLLMVTARPGGKDDIEYRTIARPVVETIEAKRMRVRIHLLRPPTFRQLQEHLKHKKGVYHIVHFDVHGCVRGYKAYKRVMEKRKHSDVRRDLGSYEGTRAFIDLVGEHGGDDLVLADDIAELLKEAHIPVCFLNACQSGMATQKAEGSGSLVLDASLAMTFLEKGIRLVLEDWLLPVVWGKGDFSLRLEKAHLEEELTYLEQDRQKQKELEGVKTKGQYGFLGRDVDILSIETFLMKKNILLVKGMGGTGKTTLLGHMAEWWMKTGWVGHVVYFGYDRKPYHAEEILNTTAEVAMPRGDFDRFLVIPDIETKALDLAKFLQDSKDTPAVLLILDNMESITGTEQAVGSRLEKKEQDKLAQVLKTLVRSGIKILLGSRADEAWLGKHTFKDSIYVLEGLDRVSRSYLAESILESISITADDRDEYNHLMEILAGYPLAMEIILPKLGQRRAKELREMLTGAGIDLKGEKDSEEIFKCINISFSLLSSRAKQAVLVFAPFTSFLNMKGLEVYLKELQAAPAFSHLTKGDMEDALSQGEKQGLLKAVFPEHYSIQPVFPFFLGQQVEQVIDEAGKATLEKAFCHYMSVLANEYFALMKSKEAGQKQMGFMLFELDRENLAKALHRVLDNEGDFYPLYDIFGFFYHNHPIFQEAIKFLEEVVEKLDRYTKKGGKFLARYGYVVGNLGTNYQKIKNFSQAIKNYKKSLELLQKSGKRHESASVYHQLGSVALGERNWEEAKRYYREALKIYQEFNERYLQASTFHQLGWVAQEEQDFEEAKRNYREAFKIFQEFNERYRQGSTFHQLGMVAHAENDYSSSLGYYAAALEIFHEYKDEFNLKKVIGNLSRVLAQEGWDASAAIDCLEVGEETRKALRSLLEKVRREKDEKERTQTVREEKKKT
ncbi:MAG: tetratricopeptide repeat protein [Candidatus Aminicenantes bacterium]|nr:tetratricopeptide repeat protein [Candidatus Aminicenantes bacterium]NIM80343.1 tetratricopeptide repeat protein [Candidatus Aminicenantes bacterium]NIN16834.1 tetratricopeptide repeat protein [Candidatus Aminicenantes bacterium]NIN40690.1 tetratricopeptide repeat protein [Candidatus Aminicenantes bacterium]NIN83513.1 tetratricopeptide repeat protein [Candidatus Aminicenantes bacterium]